jgi:hypothetical protein
VSPNLGIKSCVSYPFMFTCVVVALSALDRQIELQYLSTCPLSYPDLGGTRASSRPTWGLPSPDKNDQHRDLEGWKHSLLEKIKHDHRSPRVLDSIYSSVGTHPITAYSGNSTRGTHICAIIIPMKGKHRLVKSHTLYVKIYDTSTQAVNTSTSIQDWGCISPSKAPPPTLA